MRAWSASALGLKVGLLVGALLFAFFRFRLPAFLARDAGATFEWLAWFALAPAALAFLLGLLLGRRGGVLTCGLLGACTAFGLAALFVGAGSDAASAREYAA